MTVYFAPMEGITDGIALGRIKKLMEWPCEGDIRRKRLLRRADDIEGCINAATGE